MDSKKDINYVGLGLIMGSAIGFVFGFIIMDKFWIAPIGTGLGIVFGAMVQNMKKRK